MAANLPPSGGDVRQDRGGREGSRHKATRAQIVGSIIILITFCGGLGFMISHVLDPLTAYLATSPGMDSPSSPLIQHVAFVMALQSARFLVVLLVGPSVARLVARSLRG